METDKTYDLSLLGDLKSKVIAILIAVVCLNTFAQSFLNQLHSILGIDFSWGYYIFIFLYFILPALLIFNFLYNNIRLFNLGYLETQNGPLVLVFVVTGLICSVYAAFIWYEVRYVFAGISISIVLSIAGFLCTYIIRNKVFYNEEKEYLISITLLFFLAGFYFYQNIEHIYPSKKGNFFELSKSCCSPLALFEFTNGVKDNLSPIYDAINSLGETGGAKQWALDYAISGQTSAYLAKDSNFESLGSADSVLEKIYGGTRFFLKISENFRDSCSVNNDVEKFTSFYKIKDDLVSYKKEIDNSTSKLTSEESVKSVKKKTDDPTSKLTSKESATSVKKKIDNSTSKPTSKESAKAVKNKIARFEYATKTISLSIGQFIQDTDNKLRRYWLKQIEYIQYIGLVWFFTLLIALISILYLLRRISRDMNSMQVSKFKLVQSAANTTKNFILLILLLVAPFFKKFTESNLNLEKPYLNSDLKTAFLGKGSESNDRQSKRDSSVVRFVNIDSIKIIADTLKIDPEVINQTKVIEKIKELGRFSIDDPTDRDTFLK